MNRLTWRNVFGFADDSLICDECRQSLTIISGEICRCCGRKLETLPEEYVIGDICSDCLRWEKDPAWKGVLVKNRSLFVYDSFLKELMTRFKFQGDAVLINAVKGDLKKLWQTAFSGECVVPIPLSRKRLYERGFNQSLLLANLLDAEVIDGLVRLDHEEKQSKKSRMERLERSSTIFCVKEGARVKGKAIVLVDDIYTTGATVRHAAKALLDAGASRVSSLTLAR